VLRLQRGPMFIETGCEHDPRSSGAQCFRQWYMQVGLPFGSAGARRNLLELARSINVPTVTGKHGFWREGSIGSPAAKMRRLEEP
jgi:hypothetical protein